MKGQIILENRNPEPLYDASIERFVRAFDQVSMERCPAPELEELQERRIAMGQDPDRPGDLGHIRPALLPAPMKDDPPAPAPAKSAVGGVFHDVLRDIERAQRREDELDDG